MKSDGRQVIESDLKNPNLLTSRLGGRKKISRQAAKKTAQIFDRLSYF
jgi:hypothetical protein